MEQNEDLYTSRKVGAFLLILLLILLYNLHGWGVTETSEARYAEISREMLVSGDWLHPRLLGIQHFHKPPLTYMITALGMGLFGVNGFGARFFLQISFAGQALLVYLMGLALFKARRPACMAMVLYVTMPAVLISARNLTTDSFLTTFELLGIWAWIRYKPAGSAGWLYLFYTALALAFLTKGPVGLVFPVLVVLGYRPAPAEALKPDRAHHLAGLVWCLVLGGSWYVYLMWQDQRFVDYFLLKHTVQRYANAEAFGRAEPWWFYLVLTPVLSLPWSGVLLLHLQQLKALPGRLKPLFLLWLLVPLVFFSLSGSKLILYILPLFAGLALLLAWLLPALPARTVYRAFNASLVYFAVLALALLLLPVLLPGLELPVWALAFPLLILAALALIWRQKELPHLNRLLAAGLAFTALLVPYTTHLMGANPNLTNSTAHVADILQEAPLRGREVVVYDRLLPSLAFELNRNLVSVHDKRSSLERETQFEATEAWREHLLQFSRPEDQVKLKRLLQGKAVLVVKGKLPPDRAWLSSGFRHKVTTGRWAVYY
jgi:4-amino-4-deoxy-L-arabinose transferase-like glycosyltransferase